MLQLKNRLLQLTNHLPPKERAEKSLHEFVQQAWHIVEPDRKFIDNWHIVGICQHLEAVAEGRIKNLLINIPPGCMKSILCNVFFPAWVWIRRPSARFLHATYGDQLSIRDSGLCRTVVASDWYQDNWGATTQLSSDQNQKIRFDTTARGWRIATTVRGRGTGEHPDFLIGDDVLNATDARSELERNYVNQAWWDGAMSTRGISIGSARIIIGQRLHEQDLPGHILAKPNHRYDHICLPMEYEKNRMQPTSIGWNDPRTVEGELLCPALIPAEVVEEKKLDLGPWQVPGQFQQRPTTAGGGVIKTDRIVIRPADSVLPSDCTRFVRYWDKAASIEKDSDSSAGVLITFSPSLHKFIIVDVKEGRWEWDARNRLMLQTAEIDAVNYGLHNYRVRGEQEPGSGGKESGAISVREMSKFNVRMEPVKGSKVDRAGPFAGQVNNGDVECCAGDWNLKYLGQLEMFPVAAHDDMVDATSGAYNHLREWLDIKRTSGRSPVLGTLESIKQRLAELDAAEQKKTAAGQNGNGEPHENGEPTFDLAEVGVAQDDDGSPAQRW